MLQNLILKLKGYPIKRAERELQRIQSLSPAEFRDWQLKKRWEAARYHFENNKAYRSLFESGFPASWEQLPIVQKKHLQGDLHQLLSTPYTQRAVHVGSTSGSSGHPFFYAKDKFAHAMTYALIANRYALNGLKFGQKQARFYGIPLSGKSRQIELAKDLIFNRVRFPVFDLSDSRLAEYLRQFEKQKFRYLYGYTSALVLFARYLRRQNHCLKTICPSLQFCIVTSEVCTPMDQNVLESAFGIPVLNEYGASELDIIAMHDESGDWRLSDENLYVEILDEQNQAVPDGQEGKLILTSLHNRAFPMVRYEIGDYGIIQRGVKACLMQLSGRTNDVIHLPSGKKAAGLTFYYVSRSLLESGNALKEFIIRQTALDTFNFDIVADRTIEQVEIQAIQSAMDTYLEPGLKLKIKQVAQIPRPLSGKIKHFYSELPCGKVS